MFWRQSSYRFCVGISERRFIKVVRVFFEEVGIQFWLRVKGQWEFSLGVFGREGVGFISICQDYRVNLKVQ
jgi:hypothetical protein